MAVMNLTELMNEVRHELMEETGAIYSGAHLTRAVQKTVSLMSRLLPKRVILETTLGDKVTDEALTISSNTGTTTYHPIKVGSFSIDGEVLDTDYTINYITGVVTEISANMIDGAYTCDYELDPLMIDISTLLPEEDYIKIERIEYPAGNNPPTYPTYDTFGELIRIKSPDSNLTADKHLRVIYQKPWTIPTTSVDGDYPSHLNDAVIIGSVGQALIFLAEKYVQSAVDALSALTAPTLHVFTNPAPPDLPSAPAAVALPDTPPDFTAASGALSAVGTEITAAKVHHTAGIEFINVPTGGADPTGNYGKYADGILRAAATRVNEAIATLKAEEDIVSYYASQVAAYGSRVNEYANLMSGTIGKYREQIAGEGTGVASNNAMIADFVAQANEQEMKARNFLDIAGRYLASGQAKINEFLIMLGVKPELATSRSSSEQRS